MATLFNRRSSRLRLTSEAIRPVAQRSADRSGPGTEPSARCWNKVLLAHSTPCSTRSGALAAHKTKNIYYLAFHRKKGVYYLALVSPV